MTHRHETHKEGELKGGSSCQHCNRNLSSNSLAIGNIYGDSPPGVAVTRTVALKVLRPELAKSVGATRFEREIKVAAQLNHPHILGVFGSGDDGTSVRNL